MTKRGVTLITLSLLMLFISSAALADVTHFWNFSSGLDTANFTSATNTDNFNLVTTGGNLEFTKLAPWNGSYGMVQGGSVNSNFSLHGDFTILVDYQINTTPLGNGTQITLGAGYSLVRESNYGSQDYHVWNGSYTATTSTSNNQGTLQIQRIGGTGYFSYNDGSLHTIYSAEIGTTDIPFALSVMGNAYDGGNGVPFDVSFDNLRVTAESTPGYVPVVAPSLSLLLGD